MKPTILFIFFSGLAIAGSDWAEVKSDQFTVITDAGYKRGIETLREFEEMRQVMAHGFNLNTNTGKEIIILAVKKSRNESFFIENVSEKAGGYFGTGKLRHYAAVKLNVKDPYKVILHEYVHLIQRLNHAYLPHWFREGTAEVFSTVKVTPDHIKLGWPINRNERGLPLISYDMFWEQDRQSIREKGFEFANKFYFQAWALTHYTYLSDEGREKQYFQKYLYALDQGGEPKQAFEELLGKANKSWPKLQRYVKKGRYNATRINLKVNADLSKISKRELSEDELAAIKIMWQTLFTEVDAEIPATLLAKTENTFIQTWLGVTYYGLENMTAASTALKHAHRLDPNNPTLNYALGSMEPDTPEAVNESINYMLRVIKQEPYFSDAYYQVARLLNTQPGNTTQALQLVDKAIDLERGALKFRTLRMQILTQLGMYDETVHEGKTALLMAISEKTKAEVRQLIDDARQKMTAQ